MPSGRGPEGQATAEGRDEAIAVSHHGSGIGEEGQGENRDAGEVLGGPATPPGTTQQRPAGDPDDAADDRADGEFE